MMNSPERDTDLIQEYIELLDRKAGRPTLFGKLAALNKLSVLRRYLARAVARHPDPDLERVEAAAALESGQSWGRRFATSFWGNRVLMGLLIVGGQQLVLLVLALLALAYANLTARPASSVTGLQPPAARYAVVSLILFVFGFFFVTPLFSIVLVWGGRYFRAWRKTVPVTLLVMFAASAFTYLTFRGTQNPDFTPDSVHQFATSRKLENFRSYERWLDLNWLLKDPKFQADYEQYLRNGPGRWLTNRFDTTDDEKWADPEALKHIGEFVDSQHDQERFREWLKDYVERNKIYSEGIDTEIDTLVGPANQRFLSIWQAAPFLRDRDLHTRRHYFSQVFANLRSWGLIYFGGMILLYLLLYLVGPALRVGSWLAESFGLSRAAAVASRARSRYYAFPEQQELTVQPFFESSYALLERVHRSFVRTVLGVSLIVFAAWSLWMASRPERPSAVGTQSALMDRFVLLPTPERRRPQAPSAVAYGAQPAAQGATLPAAVPAGSYPGSPYPALNMDLDGDGFPDKPELPPAEVRLAELQRLLDDMDYDYRKRFKANEALLATYQTELAGLRAENQQLAGQISAVTGDVTSSVNILQGQVNSAATRAESAISRAEQVAEAAAAAAESAKALEATAQDLTNTVGELQKRDETIENRVDAVGMDLDERTRELTARTEVLGERTSELTERTEQIADLQQTAYTSIVQELRAELGRLELRSHSRLYRMFNKREAREQLTSLRRRIQALRGQLQTNSSPEAAALMKELTALQNEIGPVEERFQ
jgi:hypothetical protein